MSHFTIKPSIKSIAGFTEVRAIVVSPIDWFVLDLDARMKVTRVELIDSNGDMADTRFERRGNQIWTHLMPSKQPGETVRLALHYNGQPLEAPAPPWVGGFTWARTEDGSHWIATSMQFDGADLWIPCKDHPSDEPDSVAINITIPAPLYLASNGSLRGITENKDGTRTVQLKALTSCSPALAIALPGHYFDALDYRDFTFNNFTNRTAVVRDPYARWCGRSGVARPALSRDCTVSL